LQVFLLDLTGTAFLLMSAFQVSRITGMSPWCPAIISL
jgi:hypothetical protein